MHIQRYVWLTITTLLEGGRPGRTEYGANEIIPHRVELVALSSGGDRVQVPLPSCKGAATSTPEIPLKKTCIMHTHTLLVLYITQLIIPKAKQSDRKPRQIIENLEIVPIEIEIEILVSLKAPIFRDLEMENPNRYASTA